MPFHILQSSFHLHYPAGYVWREAYNGDHVCVNPTIRSEAAADNAAASSRVQPGGGPFGRDTCKQGFVWREARASDHVCVPPATRTRTARENAEGPYLVVCDCSYPLYRYSQGWFGTSPFCSGSCPNGWHLIRRASCGSGCERSRKGVCISCQSFGRSCLTGTKALCESDIASVTQP